MVREGEDSWEGYPKVEQANGGEKAHVRVAFKPVQFVYLRNAFC